MSFGEWQTCSLLVGFLLWAVFCSVCVLKCALVGLSSEVSIGCTTVLRHSWRVALVLSFGEGLAVGCVFCSVCVGACSVEVISLGQVYVSVCVWGLALV